ncbi:hypothetical protein BCT65_009595 [Vibrio splendidus]|uniref:hypothetical protein n=1 Tax=Vibrio splendidus TaxID=29497 RepID=UPI000C825C32|nr:hypothetical protein [Vibrio splendidus]MCC5517307.1 hypothetical protein [Vibrio splendidus]
MNLKVIPTQLRGRQQAIIVDSEHHPISHITDVIFANGWLTHHASALSFNSQLAYARALLLVLKHLYSRQISIVEKVENGEFMTYTQLDKLAYHAVLALTSSLKTTPILLFTYQRSNFLNYHTSITLTSQISWFRLVRRRLD